MTFRTWLTRAHIRPCASKAGAGAAYLPWRHVQGSYIEKLRDRLRSFIDANDERYSTSNGFQLRNELSDIKSALDEGRFGVEIEGH